MYKGKCIWLASDVTNKYSKTIKKSKNLKG